MLFQSRIITKMTHAEGTKHVWQTDQCTPNQFQTQLYFSNPLCILRKYLIMLFNIPSETDTCTVSHTFGWLGNTNFS